MDYLILTMAERLEHDRASALSRENELRRSIADRGVTVTPVRPVLDAIHTLGVWFQRPARSAARIRIAH
ncbi:hypothetical protein LG299_03190 [Microbacterium lacus]|uniref:hypothetical protein n=1 Tax=Microbacterium lacus TaxID=415217 RepID=UPI00384F8B87